jgi:hypothetical protein
MTLPPAPESKKENQHVVPQFWQGRFAGKDGRIFARYRPAADPKGKESVGARQAGVGSTMAGEWTYTVFDRWWRPSDALENELAKLEGRLSRVVTLFDAPGVTPNLDATWELCVFVGLAACRTPEVMARSHRRLKELTVALSEAVEAESYENFRDAISTRFGVAVSEGDYEALRQRPKDALAQTAEAIEKISPQNPVLPEQLSLTGVEPVAVLVGEMALELVDAPASHHYILGDTPLPDWDLAKGFTLPLSKSLALCGKPRTGTWQLPTRRIASPSEIEGTNKVHYENARDVVIGPDKGYLDGLM